jgi:hypothetical protein
VIGATGRTSSARPRFWNIGQFITVSDQPVVTLTVAAGK